MMRRLFYWLTGGRPMVREHFAFTDIVTGKSVNYYTDAYGRRWLAMSPWALFRVSLDHAMTQETKDNG